MTNDNEIYLEGGAVDLVLSGESWQAVCYQVTIWPQVPKMMKIMRYIGIEGDDDQWGSNCP